MKKKQRTYKIGTHRKSVIFLWLVLISSFSFALYKNFTTIDQHTVHEKIVVEEKLIDTSGIQSYVEAFAQDYFSWENNRAAIENRTKTINGYLTEDLQKINADLIRQDIPTSSKVNDVQIQNVEKNGQGNYQVMFTVDQMIKEGDKNRQVISTYQTSVHQDQHGNKVIIQNPTITATPEKSNYESEKLEADGSVDEKTSKEITKFLETFFKLYPKATKEELAYYVKDEVLKPIQKDYVFAELIDPTYTKKGKAVAASFSVKCLDQETKMIHLLSYNLNLYKSKNWEIEN